MPEFALIGYPVSHSRSPELFRKAYGGKWNYNLVETQDFEQAWKEFLDRYAAINVTSPFKESACRRADILSPECLRTRVANIAVKTADGIVAYNSDYRGLLSILSKVPVTSGTAAVIGYGGAGKAAQAAAADCGFDVKVYHHDEVGQGVTADLIIYTLPSAVEGIDKFRCNCLIEANYRNPSFCEGMVDGLNGGKARYVSGKDWLLAQAQCGYELMTGEKSDDVFSLLEVLDA